MTSEELREKFLEFFEARGHKVIPSAPLVPSDEEQLEGKEKVLFTSAGMQPLIPYLMGQPHPDGKRLVDVQKCLRTGDIDDVGDLTHLTFFEMLGNWSLGDYFKKEAIEYSFEFITKELNLPLEKLAVSVFAGDEKTPKDEESAKVWEELGIPKDKIFFLGKEHNWWPTNENIGPCGPDTEMFFWTGDGEVKDTPDTNPLWVEFWNDVFIQYLRKEDKNLEELPQKNVDTGMGLERALAVFNGKKSYYDTDLFIPLIEEIEKILGKIYGDGEEVDRKIRIIADHLRASTFILGEGIEPSNKERGYVLRRLIRRAVTLANLLNPSATSLLPIIDVSIQKYKNTYPELEKNSDFIKNSYSLEEKKFKKLLNSGLTKIEKEITKMQGKTFSGKIAFDLYQNHGLPVELTKELLKEKGFDINQEEFDLEYKKHQETSRADIKQKFAGGLAGHSEIEIKYHTATHLLHQALRDVLGPEVFQKGSNITSERLRFDYSYSGKPTDEQIHQVEEIINAKIREKLVVENKTISLEKARELNAIGLFGDKYAKEVSVYAIGPDYKYNPSSHDLRPRGGYYSLEFCGGPHVQNTSEVSGIKLIKDESISSGIRRIRAVLS